MSGGRTLILGAGFGGLAAANTLRELAPASHEILLVDRSPSFHVGAGKTWIATGAATVADISRPRAELVVPGVRWLEASVEGIDLAAQRVATDREELSWDQLVVALGADLEADAVPGLAAAAHDFFTLEGAERLRGALDELEGGELVVLIARTPFKCPPAPYEAALLFRHALDRRGVGARARVSVHTVEGAPMPTAGPAMGELLRARLAERGIAFHPSRRALRVDGARRAIEFEGGAEAVFDLLVAVPPHVAPRVAREAGLLGPSGWIAVDPLTLRASAAPETREVYAVGDVASVPLPGRYRADVPLVLPKAGVFAAEQGRVVARRIAASLSGRVPEAVFDGRGFCFLEVGDDLAMRAEGDFFASPHPVVEGRPPDAAGYRDKLDWVAAQLGRS